jgi:hypothetical protein
LGGVCWGAAESASFSLLDARFIFADLEDLFGGKNDRQMPTDGLTKIRHGVERLSRGDVVGEQHATDGLVHQLGFMDRNYHPVGWHLAGFDHDFGDSLTQRSLLFDRPSFIQFDCDFRHRFVLLFLNSAKFAAEWKSLNHDGFGSMRPSK